MVLNFQENIAYQLRWVANTIKSSIDPDGNYVAPYLATRPL